jgi:hypothetical protein
MNWIKKLLGAIGSYSVGHITGAIFGKVLHDTIAYLMPIREFSKYSWFNATEYIKLYQKYSAGLDNLFMTVFGITGGGLALALYLSTIYRKK